jgi:hypothetical protein
MNSPLATTPGLAELIPLALTREHELQVFLIHCIIVAGKSAPFGNAKTKALLEGAGNLLPFDYIGRKIKAGALKALLKETKTGNYQKMYTCLYALTARRTPLDLEACTLEELESIPYVGLKTSRYFMMYTRPEHETNDIAVIDTHVLKWLRTNEWAQRRLAQLKIRKVPKSTPSRSAKKLYLKLQAVICEHAKKIGVTARQWDSNNWDTASKFSDLSRARIVNMNSE